MSNLINTILGDMPRQRFQTPKLEQNLNGSYFIRPRIDILTPEGPKRDKRHIPIGPASIGRREAGRLAAEKMRELNQTGNVLTSQIPLSVALKQYRSVHVASLATTTQSKYNSHLDNHIEPAWGKLMLCEISTLRVQKWLDCLPKSWATKTDIRNIMSSIFTKAIAWGMWKEINPIEAVSAGRKRAVREKRKTSDADLCRLLDMLPADVQLAVHMALFCTLRVSEVLGVQERHLNFDTGIIHVRQRWCRGNLDVLKSDNAKRDVPMGYLRGTLAEHCTGDPQRFVVSIETHPRGGRAGTCYCRDDRDILQHFIRPAAKKLGIYYPGFGWHSFRREAITELSGSIGVGQAMSMAGHTSADMSLLYTMEDRVKQDNAVRQHQQRFGLGNV